MISTGTVGSMVELRVAISMMRLGWHIYRNLSPNGAVDLIATKGRHTVLKVQVKSSLNGQFQNLRAGNCDLLAIISKDDGEIRFRARTKRVAKLFPACGLVRKPKRRK